MITAPYNFVPLNKEVFYPSWSDEVNHDVPFEDGESGEIEITITAKSPIFVRDSKDESKFCNHADKEFIPSSSIKGVIRNVLDIISYSKINISDKQLSYRDLNHPSYKKKAMNGAKIHMGWLVKKGKEWIVDDLGTVASSDSSRIKYNEMQDYLGQDIVKKIRFKREAYEKYQIFKDRSTLDIDIGTIVFTGTVGKKKTREFLFPKKVKNSFVISSKIVETFKQAYYIGKVDENKNWKNLWSKELRSGNKIPVFFQLNQQNEIAHFGLSMLYKLPYENSTMDLVKKYQNYDESRADLSETIFGFVSKEKALKGRVQFSHFKIDNKKELNRKVTLPLSSPRSTFYPSYIEQHGQNGKTKFYKTYDDKDAVLRGFKLYPPQKQAVMSEKLCTEHPKVCTSFYPLGEGTTFKGKVRFFNLKKAELGALVAALTHLENNQCLHKIGMGKPYGFGTVKLHIEKVSTVDRKDIDLSVMVKEFTQTLQQTLNIDLYKDTRMKQLFALSTYTIDDKKLKYLQLRDFAFAKKPFNRFYLPQAPQQMKASIKTTQKPFKVPQHQEQTGISKTKMRKAMVAYWEDKFGIFYHPNQIKEFLSEEGFTTTPEEQVKVYIENKNNDEFIGLINLVKQFNDGAMDEALKERFYNKLTKELVEA